MGNVSEFCKPTVITMGNSYTNITLLGPEHNDVLLELKKIGRQAYISPTADGKTIVYDKESDELDIDILNSLAADLSRRFDCVALAALVFVDYVLYLKLFENSKQTVNYISRGGPRAGAWALCRTFRRKNNFPLVLFVMRIPFSASSWPTAVPSAVITNFDAQ